MLVNFRSRAGLHVTMFHDIAVELIKMMGASGRIPSALSADEVADAASRLRSALHGVTAHAFEDDDDDDDDDKGRRAVVGLPTRAVPLLELLDRAAAEHAEVMWELQGRS